jgi:hypothetical protein
VAAFMKDTWNNSEEQAEAKIREEAKIFAENKYRLLQA